MARILNSAPMARWCVEDLSGKWSELEDKDGATALCDDQPSEIRGSYGFKPLSVIAATPVRTSRPFRRLP